MKKYLIITVAMGLFFASCSDKLDVTPPNLITDEQVMALLATGDDATIDMVLGGIAQNVARRFNWGSVGSETRYSSLQGMQVMRCLEANDVCFGTPVLAGSGFGRDEYNFSVDLYSSGSSYNYLYWQSTGWDDVRAANQVLNILTVEVVGENLKMKGYRAQALVLRAYAYNFLMENYQDAYTNGGKGKLGMPLYDKYNPLQEKKARSTAEETYAFILKDVKEAIKLMTEAGMGATASTEDVDLCVANFVLARAALCAGEYATVVEACDVIINAKVGSNSAYSLMAEGVYVAKRNTDGKYLADNLGFLNVAINKEVILGWTQGNSIAVHNSWMNIFGAGSGGSSTNYMCIDNRLYEQMVDADFRKDNFPTTPFGNYDYPPAGAVKSIPAYANFKFANMYGLGSSTDKTTSGRVCDYLFRLSEVLLMKAEAQAMLNTPDAAKATLNVLLAARTRDGATTLTCDNYSTMTTLTPIQMVQLQTRIEMWGENGLEYYNNRRWNLPVDRSNSLNHPNKGSYPVSKMTMQIPDSEILYNPLAVQNDPPK